MNQTQTQTDRPTNRSRTARRTSRHTDKRDRQTTAPDDETDAPLVPDLGPHGGADVELYRPNPFERTLMEDAE
jgi:hypothetical protein